MNSITIDSPQKEKTAENLSGLRSPLILDTQSSLKNLNFFDPDSSNNSKFTTIQNLETTAFSSDDNRSTYVNSEFLSENGYEKEDDQISLQDDNESNYDLDITHSKTNSQTSLVARKEETAKSLPNSIPTTPSSVAPPEQPLSATSQYSVNVVTTGNSPVISSYSLENCSFSELKNILSEKLIQLSQVQHQNSQLWTLVNKQRTMIFDLQRDFDNAVDQNEKLAKQLESLKTTKEQSNSELNSIENNNSSKNSALNKTSSLSSTTFKISRKPSKNEIFSSVAEVSNILRDNNTNTSNSFEEEKSKKISSSALSLIKTGSKSTFDDQFQVSCENNEDVAGNCAIQENNPYIETRLQSTDSQFPNLSSTNLPTIKHRPPPIMVPSEPDTKSVLSATVNESTNSETNKTLNLSVTPLRSPSLESMVSSPSISKTPQSSVNPKSPFDFSAHTLSTEEETLSNQVSPRRSNSSVQRSPVLYVQPENISTISLEISTLIGKIKPIYRSRREDPIAIISALDRDSGKELWKIMKDYTALQALDNIIRPSMHSFNLPKLPEKSMFQSHAPTRVDARKVALESYFSFLLSTKISLPVANVLCEFLSTDAIDPMDIPDNLSRYEGYLTKRGKKIKVWKVRYFVIEDDLLNYYDKPGGELQGSISLQNAKIGRQAKNENDLNPEESVEKAFRHAFLILEHKKKSYIRHVLCAESDEDRDRWIKALFEAIAEYTNSSLTSSMPFTPTTNNALFNTSQTVLEELTSPTHRIGKLDENSRLSNIPPPCINGTTSTNSPISPISVTQLVTKSIPNKNTLSSTKLTDSSSKISNESSLFHDLRPTGSAATTHSVNSASNTNLMDPIDLIVDADETDNFKDGKKPKKKSFFSFRNKINPPTTGLSSYATSAVNSDHSFNEFQSTPYSSVEQQSLPSANFDSCSQLHSQTPLLSPRPQQLTPQTSQNLSNYEKNVQKHLNSNLDDSFSHSTDTSNSEEIRSLDHNNNKANINGLNDISNFSSSSALPDGTSKRIFGIPLNEAVQLSYKDVHHCRVPSIVYRCIELLKVRDAIFEEGIFRLSGSTATIRLLKERFNNEYDVDLVNSDIYYDIHAVAGLLKLYLREIPTLILSSYLAPEFRDAVEIPNVTTKILKLKSLVQELPRENRDLLCVLCSLLTEVIAHQDINKMNLRNVGIVFALTLNISSSVLTSFLTDFDSIFGDAAPDETKAREFVEFPSHTEML
ncbi:uncharacterized protein SAPINGB_P003317 [Magnusiomyces paraingens]|uniref:Uncharacterized protein n=1 Tax=Magnusiomyces paraingens TaxID=2606893 RepID=A0A5E8BU75_9ASCO|nr:uncharacterized protein SAPINGB_P003317 [Saprochaete ingens]VVT52927.1 unnamed protein product [Saprochaete ingens]